MKTIISFFLLICISIGVFAQNNNLFKTEKNVGNQKFQFLNNFDPNMDLLINEYPGTGCSQAIYHSKSKRKNISKAQDTLFIEFYKNMDDHCSFNMFSWFNDYSLNNIVWTEDHKKGYLLVEPGRYTIITDVIETDNNTGKKSFKIINNNINIHGNAYLNIQNTAIYPIKYDLVDIDSIPLCNQTPGSWKCIDLFTQMGPSCVCFSYRISSTTDIYMSSIVDSLLINFGFYSQELDFAREGYFLKFPSRWGLNDSIHFINNPNDFITSNVQVKIPGSNKADVHMGLFFGFKYENKNGIISISISYAPIVNWPELWTGKFYENYQQDTVKGTMGLIVDKDYTGASNIYTPVEDSIGDFRLMHPDAKTLLYGNEDTIKVGIGCFYIKADWANNAYPGSNLWVRYNKLGINAETSYNPYFNYIIYDQYGNNIGQGYGNHIEANLAPAPYSVLQNCPFYLGQFDGYYANQSFFDLRKTDPNPPILYLRTCNANGRPTWIFNKGEEAYLLFWANDFNFNTPHLPTINDDSTKVSYKYFNEGIWQEITAVKTGEDLVVGSHYKVDLSDLLFRDSVAISIKIEIMDLYGNKAVTIVEPAIYVNPIENSNITINDPGNGISVYPNPFKNEVSLIFSLKETSDLLLEIYDITGKKLNVIKQKNASIGNNTMIWNGKDAFNNNLPSGLYFYKLNINNQVCNGKLFKY